MARVVWIATGVAWALRSVLEVFAPQYFNPVTPLDHLSVWAYTAALLLTAPAVLELAALASMRSVRAVTTGGGVLVLAALVAVALWPRWLNASGTGRQSTVS